LFGKQGRAASEHAHAVHISQRMSEGVSHEVTKTLRVTKRFYSLAAL
jgi:hypothetical protein